MNEMIKAIMEDFTANLVPDAECLYLCNRKARTAHPINLGGRFLIFQKKLYLCAMNNQGLLALAHYILMMYELSHCSTFADELQEASGRERENQHS